MQLLAAEEVDALASACAARLDAGKGLPFPLTAKLVENAVEGARKTSGASSTSLTMMHLLRVVSRARRKCNHVCQPS